jgi:hypothetical protein
MILFRLGKTKTKILERIFRIKKKKNNFVHRSGFEIGPSTIKAGALTTGPVHRLQQFVANRPVKAIIYLGLLEADPSLMAKYRLVRESRAWTSRPPPEKKRKKSQKGRGKEKAPLPMPTEMPTELANSGFSTQGSDPDMQAPFGVPPDPPPGSNVTKSQVRHIWEYVLRRFRGESAAEASAAVKAELAQEETEQKAEQQPQAEPTEEDTWHDANDQIPQQEEGLQQEGSGVDDGSGVTLAADEVIHVPQGDRPKVFAHPSQLMIAGATKSGKSSLVVQIIKNMEKMFDTVPESVYWFYAMPSSVENVPHELPRVMLRNGSPTEDMIASIIKNGRPKLMIMDDMQQMMDNKNQAQIISDIFTKVSHHGNLSVIFIVQNLYLKNLIRVREQCGEIILMGNGASAAANCMKLGHVSVMYMNLYMGKYLVE